MKDSVIVFEHADRELEDLFFKLISLHAYFQC